MKKKKVNTSRLTLQEVVISLFVVLVLGVAISFGSSFIVNVFAEEDSNSDYSNVEREDLKESPYTLEEIYEFISSKKYMETRTRDEEWFDYNKVITHFYEYFSKDTPFMIYDKKLRSYWGDYEEVKAEEVNTIMIDYDEYMRITKGDGEAAFSLVIAEYPWKNISQNLKMSDYDHAARDVVGSCYEINRCANPEENNNYKEEGNI